MAQSTTFSKRVFQIAGWFGIILQVPQYFMEVRTGQDYPPPINHPEYYYGFLGVTIAFAILFLFIAKDPIRYRPMMIPSIIEKISFPAAVIVLFILGRVHPIVIFFGFIDFVFALLFGIAYLKAKAES